MRSTGKVMVSVFWNARGILLVDYLEKGHTIKGTYYADLLRQLWEKIKKIRRGSSGEECPSTRTAL